MGITTRRRIVPPKGVVQGVHRLSSGVNIIQTVPYNNLFVTQLQETVSEGHPWPPGKGRKRVQENIGGEFWTERRQLVGNPNFIDIASSEFLKQGSVGYKYTGPVYLGSHGVEHYSRPWPYTGIVRDDGRLLGQGTTAIARTIPTNPVADVAVFLGELREGLPKIVGSQLIKTRGRKPSELGGEYLNVEFGWKPLIADLQKFADATRNSERYLQQLRRDSGRFVRRRYTFPTEQTSTTTVIPNGISNMVPDGARMSRMFDSPELAVLTEVVKTTRDVWFSGCYTYYLDPGEQAMGQAARAVAEANKLYGVRLTPETLWNLAPWSWAIDWVTNAGDLIHNLVAFSNDGLVLRYGYIMEKSSHDITRTLTGLKPQSGSCPSTLSQTIRVERKRRLAASPYGFDVDWPDFTARQLGIVGALGITQGRRVGL